jgi:hypothetical protein
LAPTAGATVPARSESSAPGTELFVVLLPPLLLLLPKSLMSLAHETSPPSNKMSNVPRQRNFRILWKTNNKLIVLKMSSS